MINPFNENISCNLLKDENFQKKVFFIKKDTLLEGTVIEIFMDNYFKNFSEYKIKEINCSITITRDKYNKNYAFILINKKDNNINLLAKKLSKIYKVYLIIWDEEKNDFFVIVNNKKIEIQNFLKNIIGKKISFIETDKRVKDINRQEKAWYFLKKYKTKNFIKSYFLPEIFNSFCVAPFFDQIWDIDKIFLSKNNKFYICEIKFTYPFTINNTCYFGINYGKEYIIKNFTDCEIECNYLILVKPVWRKEGSFYDLLNNKNLKNRILLTGIKFDNLVLEKSKEKKSYSAPHYTSFKGYNRQSYKRYSAEELFFYRKI